MNYLIKQTLKGIFFALIFILSGIVAKADQIQVNEVKKIVKHIKSIRGYQDKADLYLALAIYKASVKHGVDSRVVTSVIGLESMFKINAYNSKTKDYGLMQINEANVKTLKLDRSRLLLDAEYNLEQGVKILKYMQKRYAKSEPNAWACRYNVGTRKVLKPFQVETCKNYNSKIYANFIAGL